jgi:mannose-1-phosphate guanylyltransferase/mannose-6-phosphate isomerase
LSVVPIILSGGSGTRLWPMSRASKPKQFLSFGAGHSLFQETALRCTSPIFDPRPIIVGSASHRFLIASDLSEISIDADILLEPMARDSCAAIAAGCVCAMTRDPQARVLVLAADHHIPDWQAFACAVNSALPDVDAGYLVTFGVEPDRPATSYGYIRPGKMLNRALQVEAFVEKPSEARAQDYIDCQYLWNSGNFLFRADVFLEELRRYQPEIYSAARDSFANAASDMNFLRLNASDFATSPAISVDYAVMEKTGKAAVLPVKYSWSDIGSWDSAASIFPRDGNENAVFGDVVLNQCQGNIVHSPEKLTAMIGVEDTIVITTRDCVLVADKNRAEEVKALVETLRCQQRREAVEALRVFRPWGNYEQLDMGKNYQVKRIVINPGGVLSLQKHRHRAEHWIVVCGNPEIVIDDTVKTLQPNQSVYVPLGSVHRLSNNGREAVVLIEVQTGAYLGEDDIIRLSDNYNRVHDDATI